MAPPPNSQSEVERLFHLLSRAHHQMLAAIQREIDQLKIDGGLQPGMRHIFCALIGQDDITVSELASTLGMAKSSVTGAVKRMEMAGLVELVPDAKDLRLRRVRLTSRGHDLKPACVRIDAAISDRLREAFTVDERAQICDLLSRLVAAMSSAQESEY